MRSMLSVVLVSLMATAAPLHAQTGAPATASVAPAPTAQQREAIARQDAQMSAAAARVAELIDAGKAGEVWDGSSQVMRRSVARSAFVDGLQADRARLGALANRGQPTVSRVQYAAGAAVPAGIYLNVSFPTRFAGSAQPVRELVSFRLDEDSTWRVSGYSVRAAGQ